jgi:bud site selection protein 31
MPVTKKWGKKGGAPPPKGFAYLEPVLEALENELRDKVQESNVGKRNTESIWPVHQICWQRTRYIYDMYYTHKKIDRKTYDYCIRQKIVDGNLIAKWKKPGYERLCSTYVINPANYKFGTTSICRVPLNDRDERQISAQDPTTGCMGCASGAGAGPRNIFGNKYGQDLAAVQVARERRAHEEAQRLKEQNNVPALEKSQETDDDEEDDYGPTPAAGVWAGNQQLEEASGNQNEQGVGDSETDESEEDEQGPQPVGRVTKKPRLHD